MSRSVTISCPFKLERKQRPRFGKGRAYTPAETKAFENAVGFEARAVMGPQPPIEGACAVEIYATFKPPKSWSRKKTEYIMGLPFTSRTDADNQIKAVCDALNGVVYLDDKQVADVAITRRYGREDAFRITVTEMDAC